MLSYINDCLNSENFEFDSSANRGAVFRHYQAIFIINEDLNGNQIILSPNFYARTFLVDTFDKMDERILQYYMISKGVSSSNEGRLLAITTSNEKTFVNKDIEEEGIGVITATIPINYKSGSQEYIPNLCKENISFELGKYYYSTTTNTVQLMDSVVAEYALGKTTKINSFKINGEEVVEDNSHFNGTVSLWNRVTNEYELVYDTKNKKDVIISDFTKYVSSNRIVKMKFDVAKESSGCMLPVIAVKVTK